MPGRGWPHNGPLAWPSIPHVSDHLLCYEHPLNERVRSALRLEYLFTEFRRLEAAPELRRALIAVVCDLLSLLTRADSWSELGQQLQQEIETLETLRRSPDVDAARLEDTLRGLQEAKQALARIDATQLRIPKLLLAVMQRATVPGGLAPPDMPAYTHWLNQDASTQQADIRAWTAPLASYEEALTQLLALIRARAHWKMVALEQGQCTVQGHSRSSLLRIALPPSSQCYPEISGGRQRMNIRLRQAPSGANGNANGGGAAVADELQVALC